MSKALLISYPNKKHSGFGLCGTAMNLFFFIHCTFPLNTRRDLKGKFDDSKTLHFVNLRGVLLCAVLAMQCGVIDNIEKHVDPKF